MAINRILIVEDEPHHSALLKATLKDLVFGVLGPAPTSAAALEVLWEQHADLAIVDTHLGKETCQVAPEECDQESVPVLISNEMGLDLPSFCARRASIAKPYETATIRLAMKLKSWGDGAL